MITLADLFSSCYRISGPRIDFASVRLHRAGAELACRALRAQAFTVGSDIYFCPGAFAPHTPEGLRLLAHEVAHVVQQQRGPVAAVEVMPGLAVAPAGAAEERETRARQQTRCWRAVLLYSPRRDRRPRPPPPGGVMLPNATWPGSTAFLATWTPALVHEAGAIRRPRRRCPGGRSARCSSTSDAIRRTWTRSGSRAEHPGAETLRLPGSGLVVTLGELNVLPDYLAHPSDIENAPAAFLRPLVQSFRSWSITELRRSACAARPSSRRLLPGSLGYPRLGRGEAEIGEALAVNRLGRRCGFEPWDLYSSVVGRNAAHFAPFSWYRWQSFHLMARELIERSLTATGTTRRS